MAKSPLEIIDQVRRIYDLARVSQTPLGVLGQECMVLLSHADWEQDDVEQVSNDVVELLILSGWNRSANARLTPDS